MGLWRTVALFSLVFTYANCNDYDTLLDWQGKVWSDDPTIMFVLANNLDTNLGVYAYSGNHSRVSEPTLGFHKPLELYWGGPTAGDPILPLKTERGDFKTTVLGPDRYVFKPLAPALKGVFLTVRKLDDRWVALAKMNGVPIVMHHWFGDISILPFPKLKAMIMHGYRLVDCKIDYSKEETLTFNAGDTWELLFGEDPACECEPTITCKERGESGEPCKDIVSSLINQKVVSDPIYQQYTQDIPRDFYTSHTNFESTVLINDACSKLPELLSAAPAKQLLGTCIEEFQLSLLNGHYNFLRGNGIPWIRPGPPVNHLEYTEATIFIEGPRSQFLRCVQTQSQVLALLDQQQNAISDLEHLESRLQQQILILNDSHDVPLPSETGPEVWAPLAFSTLTSVCFCVFCICSCCRRKLPFGESQPLRRNEVTFEMEMQSQP